MKNYDLEGLNQKRLDAINDKYVLLEKKCRSCGKHLKRERMWVVDRWAVNSEIVTWYFCKECFPTKEDVLNEIDTDECHFGIAYVDHPYIFEKKDNTRMYASKPPIPNNK